MAVPTVERFGNNAVAGVGTRIELGKVSALSFGRRASRHSLCRSRTEMTNTASVPSAKRDQMRVERVVTQGTHPLQDRCSWNGCCPTRMSPGDTFPRMIDSGYCDSAGRSSSCFSLWRSDPGVSLPPMESTSIGRPRSGNTRRRHRYFGSGREVSAAQQTGSSLSAEMSFQEMGRRHWGLLDEAAVSGIGRRGVVVAGSVI